MRDLEKQQSRLKEVFKTQVSNFREACYCLFGYRIDMASQVCFMTPIIQTYAQPQRCCS